MGSLRAAVPVWRQTDLGPPWQTAVQVMLNLLGTTYLLGVLQLYWALGTQETAHNSGFKDYCVRRKEMCCLLAYSESSLAKDLYTK